MKLKIILPAALFLSVAGVAAAQMQGDAEGPMGGAGGAFLEEMFARIDADNDGRVTEDELRTFRAARIEGLDADGDGFLTAEELTAHETRMAGERITRMVERRMARQDLDGDGRLSAAELAAGPGGGERGAQMFARLDTDGDNAVTLEEAEAGMQRMHDRRGGRRGEHGEGRGGWMRHGNDR